MAVTWGLDVSTNRAKTAAVAIDWSTERTATVIVHPLMASDVAPLIAEHQGSWWAVDVPFGWPDRFVALMASRHDKPLPVDARPPATDWEIWRISARRAASDRRASHQRRTDQDSTPAGFVPTARCHRGDVGAHRGAAGRPRSACRSRWHRRRCLRDVPVCCSVRVASRQGQAIMARATKELLVSERRPTAAGSLLE